MRVAIIDADLIGRQKHRFPNLACEKISAYWKEKGAVVELKLDYEGLDDYDQVYVSKVFTDTPVPDFLSETDRIHIGGTGFFFDKAPNLPDEIEHHMPDYDLYNDWISGEVQKAEKLAASEGRKFKKEAFMLQFKEYTDYSIGFVTRGCFRKCPFCVNQKYDHVFLHSPLSEFFDPKRKKICLLDDNVLGCGQWRAIFEELIATGRSFKFKQGMDERLLSDEKCRILFQANYDGDYTFAFDNIEDYETIHKKLHLIRKYTNVTCMKFYVLVAFESTDAVDIENAFKRIELLMRYRCLPYLMRYQNKNDTPWKRSEFREMYITMARWCNQPSFFKKMSFREYCEANQLRIKTENKLCTAMRAMTDFEARFPEVAAKYFDLHFPSTIIDDWVD
ncbi:MAG: hypothetical protein E7438_04415 [Ruminococcaceae bacterium]|nr:hypothetical protein [Oscillospiraceae bacterium]